MKNENQTNSFKEGLDVVKDHSASMESDWSKLEQRLERHDNRHRTLLWTKMAGIAAAVLLLLFAWWMFQPEEILVPEQKIVKEKKTEADQNQQETTAHRSEVPDHTKAAVDVQSEGSSIIDLSTVDYSQLLPKTQSAAFSILDSLAAMHSGLNQQKIVVKLDSVKPALAPELPQKPKIETTWQPRSPKLTLSIIYAPALNGVNNFSNAKVGSDVGVLLTVGLTKKLSVSTGAIYAKKLYESDFSDYNPVYKPSLGTDPQSVYADCRVLDIPLNINYSMLNKGKNSLSVGAGVSSYLMLKEDYRYVYGNDGNSYHTPEYNYSIANKNQHWFGVLNLEARYQRQLNPKFGIGLQPYLKIPINDIGFANVKLQSLGMAVNFNWNISGSARKDK